jgi:carbamoylphosphate synthase large subunit
MSEKIILNTECLREACDQLHVPYDICDEFGNVVCVRLEKNYFFVNFSTPFNNDSFSQIAKDKDFSHMIGKDTIHMPRTKSYFDPNFGKGFSGGMSVEVIVDEIMSEFDVPVIVKMNRGEQGKNVFLCRSRDEVSVAIKTIFKKDSELYDYIALAQEYIRIKSEYRVIVFRGKALLVYEKDVSHAQFTGNLSPLHYENARAVHIKDEKFISDIQNAVARLLKKIPMEFTGIDLAVDVDGRYVFFEFNSMPGFKYFVRDNGKEPLVEMYMKIISTLSKSSG